MERNRRTDRTFKRYDQSFKRAAVELLLSSDKSLKQIASELGITTWTLRDWKKRSGPPPASSLSADELQAENRRLRQELLRIKTQRDILKKRWASSRHRATAIPTREGALRGIYRH